MRVRLLTPDDAPAVSVLWQAAVPVIKFLWPGPINENYTVEEARADLEHPDQWFPGFETDEGMLQGYLLVRDEPLPHVTDDRTEPYYEVQGRDGIRLVIWVMKMGLPLTAYGKAADALFDVGWFSRVPGQLCWGKAPRTVAKHSLRYLDRRFAHIEYKDYKTEWSVWWWNV